jgi:hypothetical protein
MAEIAIKEAQLQKIQETTIDRSEHERILAAAARGMRDAVPVYVRKNAHHFVGQNSIDTINGLLMDFWNQLLEIFSAASRPE